MVANDNPTSRKRGWPMVTARVVAPDGFRTIIVTGQTASALMALVEAGPKGRTALEVSNWAMRFAAYCHNLIHNHSLNIVCAHEAHPGGWHGRHILLDWVTIVQVVGAPDREAA